MSCQALDRRGQARLQLGKYEEAIEDFENAKKADPKLAASIDKNIAQAKTKMEEDAFTKMKPTFCLKGGGATCNFE